MRRSLTGLLLAGSLLTIPAAARAAAQAGVAPAVVATIKPIHSLVAGVMRGAGEPALLIRGAASPHSYALRPSGARALRRARLVFWVGEGLETALKRPLVSLLRRGALVTLSEAKGLILLPARRAGIHRARAWEAGGGNLKEAQAGDGGGIDPHIWLDPQNAQHMARKIAAELSRVDPANAALYQKNAAALSQRLGSLTGEIRAELDPLAGAPYVVFHDAYRYFESRFGLSPAGAIAVAPGRRPGAKRLTLIRSTIRSLRVACILAEPQFTPRLAKMVMEGTGARLGVLDPLGADLKPGGDMYFSLMRRMTSSLRTCLAPEAGR